MSDGTPPLPAPGTSFPGFAFRHHLGRPYASLIGDRARVSMRIACVGPEVIELVAESTGLELLDGSQASLTVPAANVEMLRGRVVDAGDGRAFFFLSHPEPESGARLLQLGCHQPQGLGQSIVPPGERLTSPAVVRSVMRALLVNDTQATIVGEGADWRLRPLRFDEQSITWTVLERGGAPCSPLIVEVSGYSASYELPVLMIEDRGQRLRTTLPRVIDRVRRRRMPRVATKGELTVSFEHPIYRQCVHRPIVNVSEEGIGVDSAFEQDLLCPGLELTRVDVRRNGETLVSFAASVRTVNVTQNKVGLRVHPAGATTSREWGRIVRELLHERTRSSGYSADALWDLYQSAGYLSLAGKNPDDFAALKASFDVATKRLANAPEVGHHFVWPSERKDAGGSLDAAVTNVFAFSTAYFGYQMAKRPGKIVGGAVGKQMLRDIHWHSLEEALSNPSCEWCIICVQATTRFSNLLFVDFPARFRDPKREAVVPFRPYQITCNAPADPARVLEALATPDELAMLCNVVQATRPAPYWQCQDLTLERIDLAEPRARWAQAGLERDRAVLVLREAGMAKAAMVLDLGHPGLHLFGFFDVAHFFSLDGTGERLLEPMLEMAKAWYAQRGRRSFMYFHEGSHELAAAPDRTDLGAASYCIISVHLIPDLLDYLFETMSWDPNDTLPPPPLSAPLLPAE